MSKQFYGYMRLLSLDQNDAQRQELERWGIIENNLFSDMRSGKQQERPDYQKLRRKIQQGDVLVVKSMDCLGRNYEEILEEWRYLAKEKKADIVVLDMPILDTRTNKDLIGTLLSDIVLQLLTYVAQTERVHIRQRQAEGIAIARAKGIHLGRPARPLPQGFSELYAQWKEKRLTFTEFAQKLNITQTQLKWLVRKTNQAEKEKNQR